MSRFITVLTCLALVLAACGKERTSEDVLPADAEIGQSDADSTGGDAGDTTGDDDGEAPAPTTTLATVPPTTAPPGDVALTADFGDAQFEITHGEMNELVSSATDSEDFFQLALGGVRPPDLQTVVLTQQLAAEALLLEIDEVGASVEDADIEDAKQRLLVQVANLFAGAPDPVTEADRLYGEVEYLQFLAGYQAGQDVLTAAIVDQAPEGEGNPCVSHILVATEAEAQSVLDRLADGEEFADLARELSTDPGSGAAGGDLGCAPAANYVPTFAAAVESAELGQVVGPVESDFGFHVLIVDRYEIDGVQEASGRLRERLSEADITVDERLGTWDPSQFTVLPAAG